MKIELHPEAVKSLDKKADELASKIEIRPHKVSVQREENPDRRFATEIKSEDIVLEMGSLTEGLGQKTAIFKFDLEGQVGFFDASYKQLGEFVDLIKSRFQNRLSKLFIEECYTDWAYEKLKTKKAEQESFMQLLVTKAETVIKTIKLGVPVDNLYLQSPLKIGRIVFEYVEEGAFTSFEEMVRKSAPPDDHRQEVSQIVEKLRKDFQGKIIATMSLEAEYEAALEIFSSEANRAVTILKFFSPPAFVSQLTSYVGLRGSIHLPIQNIIRYEHGTILQNQRVLVKESVDWGISDQELNELKKAGLTLAVQMAEMEDKSALQQSLMDSISLFVKGITSSNFHDRLVLILVSVESLLLRDTNEPISSFKPRLAILTHESPQERSSAIDLLGQAYTLRSGYLHHGNSSSKDIGLLGALQCLCHTAIVRIIQLSQRFTDRHQLIQALQDLSLCVPSSAVLLKPKEK